MTTHSPRHPSAFILKDEEIFNHPTDDKIASAKIEFEPLLETPLVTVPVQPITKRRGIRWGFVLLGSISSLITLWAGLSLTTLVEEFFNKSPALGWLAFGLTSLVGLALVAIIGREMIGLWRLRKIEHLQALSARALNFDEAQAAHTVITETASLYSKRPDLRWAWATYTSHRQDVMDPRDKIKLLNQIVVRPLDEEAHRIIARRARRVTLLTTVTPAAALDMLLVISQNLIMMRELATLYGGRPSTLSTLRLARLVVGHLAVTGGLALSDNLLQHVVGKGLLGRLSARFGEGAVNGIMTSRIGLATVEVCRPIPLEASRKETLASLLREVLRFTKNEKDEITAP